MRSSQQTIWNKGFSPNLYKTGPCGKSESGFQSILDKEKAISRQSEDYSKNDQTVFEGGSDTKYDPRPYNTTCNSEKMKQERKQRSNSLKMDVLRQFKPPSKRKKFMMR